MKNPKTKKGALKELKHMGQMDISNTNLTKRLLVFTPSRGLVRMEWVHSRYGQIIPTNFSMVDMVQYLSPYVPVGYQLADAQNLMAKVVVEGDYQWIIYIEDDNMLPPNTFRIFNEYMIDGQIPIVSGLYFTKSQPPEPILYRGRGTGYFNDFKVGDLVWADGIPFGCRLENAAFIKEAWKTSPEYMVNGEKTRRVFSQPQAMYQSPDGSGYETIGGTTDLEWCKRIMEEDLFTKAGFPQYSKKKYPFLVDTNVLVKHIDQSGVQWPTLIPHRFQPNHERGSRTIE